MKNLFSLLFFLAFLPDTVFAQWSAQRSDSDCARLVLTSDTINYGSVTHNSNVYREMKFKNAGKCPLIIWSVNGLNPRQMSISKNYVQAGDSGVVSIYYPTDQEGSFFKTLIIYSNAPAAKVLYIEGTILPDEICAQVKFASDTINLGAVHYAYGKHFVIKVPSNGRCPLVFRALPADEYMNVLSFSREPIKPGDSGTVDIHIGASVAGNYYGLLRIMSGNATTERTDILIKAAFSPPDKGDSTDTEISVEKDLIDVGTLSNKISTVRFTIKNTGRKTLVLNQPSEGNDMIKIPHHPIAPGKSDYVLATFDMGNMRGLFIKHIVITGNFKGKSMPLYIRGYLKN